MSARGLAKGGDVAPAGENWANATGRKVGTVHAERRQRQSCSASRRSDMDKIESFIFSVALICAGLITLVTLPLA